MVGDDYFVLHYIVHFLIVVILYCIIHIYSFSDNCIQFDDGQIRNGRNM